MIETFSASLFLDSTLGIVLYVLGLHIRNGRLAEVWNYSDIMGLAAQLQARSPLEIEI